MTVALPQPLTPYRPQPPSLARPQPSALARPPFSPSVPPSSVPPPSSSPRSPSRPAPPPACTAGMGWLPDAGRQSGPHGMYVKRHTVPFAEYIPLRSMARMVSKRVDLVARDLLAGGTPGVLDMGGRATVGEVICFEVAYDG